MLSRMLNAIREVLSVLPASDSISPRNAGWADPTFGVSATEVKPTGWLRSSDRFGVAGALSFFGFGSWQQAVPQQSPSTVPQQQILCPWSPRVPAIVRASPAFKRGQTLAEGTLSSKLAVTATRMMDETFFIALLYACRRSIV